MRNDWKRHVIRYAELYRQRYPHVHLTEQDFDNEHRQQLQKMRGELNLVREYYRCLKNAILRKDSDSDDDFDFGDDGGDDDIDDDGSGFDGDDGGDDTPSWVNQPRDADGRWTSDGGSDNGSSDGQGNAGTNTDIADQAPSYDDMTVPDSWGNPDLGNFEDHYEDHGDDFDATSPEDYADQANQFYDRFQNEDLPAVEGADGTIRVYDPDANTFGAYNADGTTKTFYQPKTGVDYFQNQIDRDLADGGRVINPLSDQSGPENPGPETPYEPFTGSGGRGAIDRPGFDNLDGEIEE